jgi:HEAT repeat protein
MPESADQAAKPVDRRDRRVLAWWGIGLGLLTVLGLVCWLVVAPVLEVRRELGSLYAPVVASAGPDEEKLPELLKAAVKRLGGPGKALPKIRLYLRMPERVAPCKHLTFLLLGECGEPAVDTLIDCLWIKPNFPGTTAAWALGEIGPPAQKAVPRLVLLAGRCSDGSIGSYIEPLQKIDPQGALVVPLFMELLGKGDQELSSGAFLALGFYGPAAKPAVPFLVKALDEPATAAAAARALVGVGREARDAVPALIKALESKTPGVSRNAIWALGRIGPEASEAAPALVAIVRKEGFKGDQEARYRAAMALGRLGRNAVPAMVAELENCQEEPHPFAESLIMLGSEAVPEMLKVKDDYCGLTTILYVLGELGPDAASAVPWLIGKLQRPGAPWAWADVARTLGRIGPAAKDAVPALVAMLGDESPQLRREVAAALGRIGPDARAALPTLDGMSGDKDACVCLAAPVAAWRLKGETDKAVAALVEGLASDETREFAIDELGVLGPKAGAAAPALVKHLPDSAVAYWRITGDAYTALNALLPPLLSRGDSASADGARHRAMYRLKEMGPAAKPALGWLMVAQGANYGGLDAAIKPWAYWHIRGIDTPPTLRPEDSELRFPLPKPRPKTSDMMSPLSPESQSG